MFKIVIKKTMLGLAALYVNVRSTCTKSINVDFVCNNFLYNVVI